MGKKFVKFTVVLLVSVLMTACGKSYDFSQKELTEAIGVKRDIFDKMEIKPDDDGEMDNELMEQAADMIDAGFYTYWFAHNGSESDYDIVEVNFARDKVGSVKISTMCFDDWYALIPSEYSILGIHVGDAVGDAKAKAEAHFGEKGYALSEDNAMWGITDGVHDCITYGDFTGSKGFMQIVTNLEDDAVISVEYSKY